MRREERSETELVLAARADDPEAFGVLFDRWFGNAWNVARTIVRNDDLAADVAQDALLAAWQGLGELRDPEAFGGWVLRIARNRALNRLAREQRSTAAGDEVVSGLKDRGLADPAGAERPPAPDLASEIRDRQELVWAAAAALGERDASLLDLHLRHGLTPAEIAEEMGVAANAAHQQLFRLRTKLGDAIGSYLLWRNGRPLCEGLAQAVSGQRAFDRKVARAVARHQASCEHCSEQRASLVDPSKLFAAVPLVLVPSHLKAQAAAALQSAGVPTGAGGGSTPGGGSPADGTGPTGGNGTSGVACSGPSPTGGNGTSGVARSGPSPTGPRTPLLDDTVALHAVDGPKGYGPAAALAAGPGGLLTRLDGLPRPKLLTMVGALVLLALTGLAVRSLLAVDRTEGALDSIGAQTLVAGADQDGSEPADQDPGGSADLAPSGPVVEAPSSSAESTGSPTPTAPVTRAPTPSTTGSPVETTSSPTEASTDTSPETTVGTDPSGPSTDTTDTTATTAPPSSTGDSTSSSTSPPDTTPSTDPPPPPPEILRFVAARLQIGRRSCLDLNLGSYRATWATDFTEAVTLSLPDGSSVSGGPNGSHQFCGTAGRGIVLVATGPGGSTKDSTTLP